MYSYMLGHCPRGMVLEQACQRACSALSSQHVDLHIFACDTVTMLRAVREAKHKSIFNKSM